MDTVVVTINLNDVSRIKKFTELVHTFDSDIDVIGDRSFCDAKSLLGLYTISLSKPVKVRLISDDEKEVKRFNKVMEEFK